MIEFNDTTDLETVTLRALLLGALRERGYTELTIHFDGGGDSGSLGDWLVQGDAAIDLESLGLGAAAIETLEELCYGALPGGWEINSGSSGWFTIDVATGVVDFTFEWGEDEDEDDDDADDADWDVPATEGVAP